MQPRALTPAELKILSLDPDMKFEEIARRLKMTKSCALSLSLRARKKIGTRTRAGATLKLLRQGTLTLDQITFLDRA